ncbi:TetR/AcrR family transcriptional regulator [Arhodomonas sp. AD133]|uniref:TetR/AcrR family transcriptional regulator n=1 Tax=Arhodomonas sp. AD133 TaxID=3415009 RepID=UPI003EBA02BA
MVNRDRPRKGPGRPSGPHDDSVREQLLEAAGRLFARQGVHQTSLAEVSEAVGVNSAMVRYYFTDKRGLYREVIHRSAEPIFRHIEAVTRTAPSQRGEAAARFMATYMREMAQDQWLPTLLVRDVLMPDGEFREEFVRAYAHPAGGGMLAGMAEAEIGRGHLREDLTPGLTALTLISLALFPFVARPIVSEVFDVDITPERIERLVAHTVHLFYEGAATEHSRDAWREVVPAT